MFCILLDVMDRGGHLMEGRCTFRDRQRYGGHTLSELFTGYRQFFGCGRGIANNFLRIAAATQYPLHKLMRQFGFFERI